MAYLVQNVTDALNTDQRFKQNPFVFFSTGESLIDKDRDLNIDSRKRKNITQKD